MEKIKMMIKRNDVTCCAYGFVLMCFVLNLM